MSHSLEGEWMQFLIISVIICLQVFFCVYYIFVALFEPVPSRTFKSRCQPLGWHLYTANRLATKDELICSRRCWRIPSSSIITITLMLLKSCWCYVFAKNMTLQKQKCTHTHSNSLYHKQVHKLKCELSQILWYFSENMWLPGACKGDVTELTMSSLGVNKETCMYLPHVTNGCLEGDVIALNTCDDWLLLRICVTALETFDY